jgi:hypothetical protein
VLVWDLTGRAPDGRWQTARQAPERLTGWWDRLAADARTAGDAVWALATDPEGSVALLGERLRPVARPDAARVGRLMADLNNDEFAVRERAERDLAALGDAVAVELRQGLRRATAPEERRRLGRLIESLEATVPADQVLQALRGVEVLEHIGTPQARGVLRALAQGAPGARLTREAAASLGRLDRRTKP